MSRYVIATRPEYRGKARPAAEVVALLLPGVSIIGGDNPDRVIIEADVPVAGLRAYLGDAYRIESEASYTPDSEGGSNGT